MQYQNHYLNTEIFCKPLKLFLLRICDNFYGNPTRNNKVRGKKYFTQMPSKTVWFKTFFKINSFINAIQSK